MITSFLITFIATLLGGLLVIFINNLINTHKRESFEKIKEFFYMRTHIYSIGYLRLQFYNIGPQPITEFKYTLWINEEIKLEKDKANPEYFAIIRPGSEKYIKLMDVRAIRNNRFEKLEIYYSFKYKGKEYSNKKDGFNLLELNECG